MLSLKSPLKRRFSTACRIQYWWIIITFPNKRLHLEECTFSLYIFFLAAVITVMMAVPGATVSCLTWQYFEIVHYAQGDRSKKKNKNKGDSRVTFHENVLPWEELVASSWNTSGSPEHRRSHHHQSSLIYFFGFYFSLLSSLLTPLTLFLSKSFSFLFIKSEADRHLLLLAMFWWDPLGMHFHLLTSAVYPPQHCRGARAWGSPSQQSCCCW